MGESRLSKKLHRLLEECEKDHSFRGVIQELTTSAAYASRLVRGMTVETNDGVRKVNFVGFLNSDPVVNTSHLKVGDEVVVLGNQHRHGENETAPILILYPANQQLLLAREREKPQWKGSWTEWVIAVCYVLSGVLGFLSLFAYPYYNTPFTVLLVIGAAFLYIILGGTIWYSKFSRRERLIHCGVHEWDVFTKEISSRFNIRTNDSDGTGVHEN